MKKEKIKISKEILLKQQWFQHHGNVVGYYFICVYKDHTIKIITDQSSFEIEYILTINDVEFAKEISPEGIYELYIEVCMLYEKQKEKREKKLKDKFYISI